MILLFVTVWVKKPRLHVLVYIRKTIRHMWSKRIGKLVCGSPYRWLWLLGNGSRTCHPRKHLWWLRLYINFFQPSFKFIAEERIGNKTVKRYDTAKTPYQRMLECKDISFETKYIFLPRTTILMSIPSLAMDWRCLKSNSSNAQPAIYPGKTMTSGKRQKARVAPRMSWRVKFMLQVVYWIATIKVI